MNRHLALLLCWCLTRSIGTAAPIILNEYNAISSGCYLDGNEHSDNQKQDAFFASTAGMPDGRLQGNGGNWIELVVTEDHVDVRGWEIRWAELSSHEGTRDIWTGDPTVDQGVITLSNADLWADLRAGTILTIGELQSIPVDTTLLPGPNRNFTRPDTSDGSFDVTIDMSTDVSFDPAMDDWWIRVSTLDELDSPEPLVTTETNVELDGPGNFSVGNQQWQLTILDALDSVVFGPAGEGIGLLRGVGNWEVAKLEEDPSALIDLTIAAYNDGSSSSFGAPNIWNGGMMTQDFSRLRARPLQAGDADQDLDFDQLDLVRVQVAAKYLTGQPATWSEGDWDGAPGGSPGDPPMGDGQFTQQDVVAALRAGNYLTGSYATAQASWQNVLPAGPTDIGSAVDGLTHRAGVGGEPARSVPVPEPAGAGLFLWGLLLWTIIPRGLVTAVWPTRSRH